MGIRADRRKRREEKIRQEKNAFLNGKTYLPPDLIYKHCIGCKHHIELQVSYRKYKDVFQSKCKLKSRKPYEITSDPFGTKTEVKGKPDIKESCDSLALIVLDADCQGLYGGAKK